MREAVAVTAATAATTTAAALGAYIFVCPLVIGELGPPGVPSAPQLGVSDRMQSFLRGNSDPTVTVFGFADKVLHNLTPRVPEGEFWESTGQQDLMALFFFWNANCLKATVEPLCCVLSQVHHIFLPPLFVPHGPSLNVSMCLCLCHTCILSRESFVKLQLFKLLTFLGRHQGDLSHSRFSDITPLYSSLKPPV